MMGIAKLKVSSIDQKVKGSSPHSHVETKNKKEEKLMDIRNIEVIYVESEKHRTYFLACELLACIR